VSFRQRSDSKNPLVRISHAVAFTFVDKTDSGHNIFAFSNFAGAAAGGFVGMGFLRYACSSVGKYFLVYKMKTKSAVIITIVPTQITGRSCGSCS